MPRLPRLSRWLCLVCLVLALGALLFILGVLGSDDAPPATVPSDTLTRQPVTVTPAPPAPPSSFPPASALPPTPAPAASPSASPSVSPTPSLTSTPATTSAADIETVLAGMSLRDKIASLFWVRPEQLGGAALSFTDRTAQALAACPVSGVVLFGNNIQDGAQVRALNAAFREAGGPGFVTAVDEEGGRVSRLGGMSGFPKTPAMGKLKDGASVYGALFDISSHLHAWGFNLDFAPVCDVLTNPQNTVIGNRAFGQDAETVSALVPEAVRGLLEAGVQPCLKHFPGHGATAGDSHTGAVSLPFDLDRLREVEWPPFTAGLDAGARVVMVGHIALPECTGDDTPGSLSRAIVTGYLRGELGFQGLVVTDSMQMGAITGRWDAGQAAVAALSAGCDVILMPEDLQAACDGVYDAVQDGVLTEGRINASVRRRLEIFL